MKTIKIKLLSEHGRLPVRSYQHDAGLDIFSAEDAFIPVGTTCKISTDIAVNIEPGYYAQMSDRSGMATKGLRIGAGVVDAGYHGHMCVVMHNLNNTDSGKESWCDEHVGYQVRKGDRIAQLVVMKVELPVVEEVAEFEASERGTAGFNSTGR